MNKYEKYALRQMALNMLYPPSENNKVFGSRFAFDLINSYFFFSMEDNKEHKQEQEQPKKKELTPEEKALQEAKLAEIYDYINKPTKNPFIKFHQWFIKYIMGAIVLFAKATKRLD